MSRRARLLIYEGPDEWIEATKSHEFVQLGKKELGEERSILSIELTKEELDLYDHPDSVNEQTIVMRKIVRRHE